MTSLRSRETIQKRLQKLKNTTIPTDEIELNARGWNVKGMERRAKIEILEWVLHDWRSHVDIYRRYRGLQNTGTTFDEEGDRTAIRIKAQVSILEWVMNDNPTDPRDFFERLDITAEEILYLGNDARSHSHPKTNTEINPVEATEFDADYLEEELHDIWRALRDVRNHMCDDHNRDPR